MRPPFCSLIVCLFPGVAFATVTDDGIFAVFDTNHGSFTCELFFEEAPMTVANFAGLAEGSREWLDPETGLVEGKPFYDGLTFHRTIPGFMIQSGSPNAQGTDGPGYRFPDEFRPDLVHDEPGVLSMANAGPDTNGSQFFVTVIPTEWLNYRHAVFGHVIEGMDVVEAISDVETDDNDRPEEPVIIHFVEIIRNGAAAQEFDVAGQGLPVAGYSSSRLENAGGEFALRVPGLPEREYSLLYSDELKTWQRSSLVPEAAGNGNGATFNVAEIATDRDRQFYRVTEIDRSLLPEPFIPESLVGKTLDLDVKSDNLRIVLYPNDERTEDNAGEPLGTGDYGDSSDLPLDYLWREEGTRGRILFVLGDSPIFQLDLLFIDNESGTFAGIADTGQGYHGLFTLTDRE